MFAMERLDQLLTEARNPATEDIDKLPTLQMLEVINAQDREIAEAVHAELGQIARAVDGITDRLRRGGRLFYQGAGTSGRLGVLDASECRPTFNLDAGRVVGVIAGGDGALRLPVERAEDEPAQGERDLKDRDFSAKDALVGIAASGRTPYVLGGIAYARALGALTVGMSCVPHSELAKAADIAITPAVGPEVITGSTRLRAGTATKLVLNMLSTGTMIRLGLVYGNLMVNLQTTNEKLKDRAARIVSAATGVDRSRAESLLADAGTVPAAIVMQKLGVKRDEAARKIEFAHGRLRTALGETSSGDAGEEPQAS